MTVAAFSPITQLSFNTFGIMDKNNPKMIENVAV